MSAANLVKKAGLYTLFYASSSLFAYYLISLGLYPYLAHTLSDPWSENSLLNGVYLPLVFLLLSLLIAILSERVLVSKKGPEETRLSAIANLVFFGAMFLLGVLLLAKAGVEGATLLALSLIPLFSFCVIELAISLTKLISLRQKGPIGKSTDSL
jgi:hypothetical protein